MPHQGTSYVVLRRDRPLTFYLQHIDLRTAKKEDLDFAAPFKLRSRRKDCVSSHRSRSQNVRCSLDSQT